MSITLKLGLVDYLNALPVYYAILHDSTLKLPCQLIKGTPVQLNQQMANGALDLSLVSSFEYALHPHNYYLLPHLSIGAKGPVHSIYLFTRTPLDALTGPIYLTAHSHTSIHLVKYLLRHHSVSYLHGSRPPAHEIAGEMLIGDEAIASYYHPRFPNCYDLSSLWNIQTGLPFVFAVWVVRRSIYEKYAVQVRQIYRMLIRSRDIAESYYEQIASQSYPHLFPTMEACLAYLKNLNYAFTPDDQAGFLRFQEVCVEMGFLTEIAQLQFIAE